LSHSQENPGELVPECLHSGVIGSKDNGGDGDTWSYRVQSEQRSLADVIALSSAFH